MRAGNEQRGVAFLPGRWLEVFEDGRACTIRLTTEERCDLAADLLASLIADDLAGPHLIDAAVSLELYAKSRTKVAS